MSQVLLIRHGQSTWNAEHRWQGWADPPLSAEGRISAIAFAQDLAPVGFKAIVSSNLLRARETAEIVAGHLKMPDPQLLPALRERDGGDWTGKTSQEIEASHPGWLDKWRSGEWVDPPGCESREVLLRRSLGGIREASHPEGPTLAITHGGVLRVIEGHLGHEVTAPQNLHGLWVEVVGSTIRLADHHRWPSA